MNRIVKQKYGHLFYEGTKRCPRCEKELPNNYYYFPPDGNYKTGLRNICRECDKKYAGYLDENFKPVKKWTPKELQLLKDNYSLYENAELVEKFFPDRTIKSVESQAYVLGINYKSDEVKRAFYDRRNKIVSQKLKGRVLSAETKKKISISIKEYYKTHNCPMKGKKLSAKRCEEISKRRKESGAWCGDSNPRHINPLFGSDNGRWNGGVLSIKKKLWTAMAPWRDSSMKFCNYKCVITGGVFMNIHHTTPFNELIDTSFSLIGIDKKKTVGDYTDDELNKVIDTLLNLHTVYGYGACIDKDVHKLFHDNYGYISFTPNNFLDFIKRIKEGEFDKWFLDNNLKINVNEDYVIYLNNLCRNTEVA